jgi:hypothetical protein
MDISTAAPRAVPANSESPAVGEQPIAPTLSRIDPAHVVTEADSGEKEAIATFVPVPEPSIEIALPHFSEQLHAQALQLGGYLREKQAELDRREALVNAREAKLENESRLARLWARERHAEVAEREHAFAARHQALEQKSKEVALAELAADRDQSSQQVQQALREQALAARAEELAAQEQRFSAQWQSLDTARTRLEQQRVEQATAHLIVEQQLAARQAEAQQTLALQLKNIERASLALEEREHELAERAAALVGTRDREAWEARLADRAADLEQTESLLSAHARDIDQQRNLLAELKEQHALELREQRREFAAEQQRERAQLAARKEQVDLASEALDKHRAAVEQLRHEAARLHREALEMRLVSEQIWQELAGHLPPVELTRLLSALRQRLAESYRAEHQRLAAQQVELQQLGGRLDEQQRKLVEQREQTRTWLSAQNLELESQAARIVAREQDLDKQQAHFRAEEVAWRDERSALRRQVRELLARLRGEEALV